MSNALPPAPRRAIVDMFNEVPGGANEEMVRAAAISLVSRAYIACGCDMHAASEMVKDALALGLGAMTVAHEGGLSQKIVPFRGVRHAKH